MHGKYSNTVLFRLKTYSQVKKVTSNYLNKKVTIISLQPKSFEDIFENIE